MHSRTSWNPPSRVYPRNLSSLWFNVSNAQSCDVLVGNRRNMGGLASHLLNVRVTGATMYNQDVRPNDKPQRNWQEIAAELSQEQDPQKVIQLSRELNDVMLEDERRKAQQRVQRRTKEPPASHPSHM